MITPIISPFHTDDSNRMEDLTQEEKDTMTEKEIEEYERLYNIIKKNFIRRGEKYMNVLLNIINNYTVLINSFMTLVKIIVSIISAWQTNRKAKKEQESAKQEMSIQKEQFEIQIKQAEEIERMHEQPYLVFKEAKLSEESDNKIVRIDMYFINKGRGAAYDITPELRCEADTTHGNVVLSRCDAIQDPIAKVGEKFKTVWSLGYDKGVEDFVTYIPINYTDASGRKYVQRFNIIFNKSGYASITNFAQPELCVNSIELKIQ